MFCVRMGKERQNVLQNTYVLGNLVCIVCCDLGTLVMRHKFQSHNCGECKCIEMFRVNINLNVLHINPSWNSCNVKSGVRVPMILWPQMDFLYQLLLLHEF
jgi:hypothetical protein